MILINVLPPEFRKRDTGVSPVFLAILVGALLNLAVIGLAVWVHYVRIPDSESQLALLEEEVANLKIKEAQVQAQERKILLAEQRRDTLFALLGKKVFNARALNEFVTLLGSGGYSEEGFHVSINKLTVALQKQRETARNRRGPAQQQAELQQVEWDWSLKIVGDNQELSGNYLKSFFQRVENSPFWAGNNFNGNPADTYTGDQPDFNMEIERVTLDCQLKWIRVVRPIKFVAREKPVVVATSVEER